MPAVCPVQAVLQEGLIASHHATAAAGLSRLQKVQTVSVCYSPWPLHCGDTSPGMGQ